MLVTTYDTFSTHWYTENNEIFEGWGHVSFVSPEPNVVLGRYLFVVTLEVANAKFDMMVTVKEEDFHWPLPLCRSLLPHALQEFLWGNT